MSRAVAVSPAYAEAIDILEYMRARNPDGQVVFMAKTLRKRLERRGYYPLNSNKLRRFLALHCDVVGERIRGRSNKKRLFIYRYPKSSAGGLWG